MSQTKNEFHIEEIEKLIQNIRMVQNPQPASQLCHDLDWIAYHARQLETKCKDCADSQNETPSGLKYEDRDE